MPYDIHTDVKYAPLELVEAGKLADECAQPWWNQTLSKVNDAVVRLGVFLGEFHWHSHAREDEFFFVLEGELLIDLEGRQLGPAGQSTGADLERRGTAQQQRGRPVLDMRQSSALRGSSTKPAGATP